ncbi:lipocalin-like domain-containing protein [Urechidicola croceus]|uniref:Lipocalin-like domain-containing protein n=1 Tax=Urechidicola croceus TaxID=1850246 RepID=A0A1D8P832_9FLAO|nr:lipocalin family protein [Urechidicola croceus]AOW20729.1 hypothetical protein LPB138_08580 [Urechidicola croceus]AOW20732.1 hypothetical protein LPB138_08595 [Urechidicola croceus]
MKKMKLFCGILIGLMIFSSCSSDDDSNSDSTSIVGIWKPIKEVDVCSTGSEETYDFSICEQKSRVTFSSNETLNITDFDDNTGDCLEDYNENGTWSLTGDNLSVTLNGETNNPTFFELTNNTLRIGYYDNDENDPCDGGNLPSHYYTEYTRVE